ncbi:TRI12-domain-containing protein [Aspergillus piperis CBS 112811]|uniref:TRI12-domain-containing protein n=1 Tax=Aspergillus piperis CBS 112811 TaxID=1448313 RepID=A0A8G1QWJ4_9EURO|nr:TRI12-domain-containing protein [Aspergillus piperis CBS 112811]RAH54316.1 TRI12-domain-containing protein [Aspergillus piperis CBS 112811]
MTAIGLGLLAAIAGFAFPAPLLAIINQDIGPSADISWVSLTYTLTIAVGLTLIGGTTDIFLGRRYIFIGGGVLGTVGSIVCARADSVNTLIGDMTLIGLAASTRVSYFYVVAELVPMKYRFAANSLMYIFTTPGRAFAPAIGESLVRTTSAGWRGVFYVLIAINAVVLLCFTLFYWPPTFQEKHDSQRKWAYVRQFDYFGTLLFVSALALFLMGLSWGGSRYPWLSSYVVATIVVGGLSFIAFILWEWYGPTRQPLVPMRMLRDLQWTAAVITSGLGSSLYYGLAIVWPSMVSLIYASGNSVPDSLLSSLVGAGCIATLAIAGILFACVATCTVDSHDRACWLVAFGTFFAGWVEGLSLPTTTLALGDQDELGTGCGFGDSIRFSITTVVTAIYNVIITTRSLPPEAIQTLIAALSAGQAPTTVVGVTPGLGARALQAFKEANIQAYRTVFFSTIAVTGLGLVATLLLPDVDSLMSEEATVTLSRTKHPPSMARKTHRTT